MTKKFFASFLIFAAVFFAAGCSKETETPEPQEETAVVIKDTPMTCFKSFREAVIANDPAKALSFTAGELLEELQKNGITNSMRKMILSITAAYEDITVRQSNPADAVVCAFFTVKGKEQIVTLKMLRNESGVEKIISISSDQHIPTPYLEQFLKSCADNNSASFKEYLSDDLKQSLADIPVGLTSPAETNISLARMSNDKAMLAVTRNGQKGNVSMLKKDFIWKILEIDDSLTRAMPRTNAETFCSAISSNNAEELKELISEEILAELTKNDLKEENRGRFSAVKLISEKVSGDNATVEFSFETDKETGNIILAMTVSENKWQVSSVSFSNINAKVEPGAESSENGEQPATA